MKIIFIQHSCFWVELDSCVLLFDWFDSRKILQCSFGGVLPELPSDKKIYVFASHKHKDHFDLNSLQWAEKRRNIRYIFSKDIRLSDSYLVRNGISPKVKEQILFVRPHESYKVDILQVNTLRSTDAGVAFYVKVNETSFYHAGDLNNWQTDDFDESMKIAYEAEIDQLKSEKITASFVVCDPRLKSHTLDGIHYFFQNVRTKYLFPMHMWRDYQMISDLKQELRANQDRKETGDSLNRIENIMDIQKENQEFFISKSEET